MKNVVKLNAPRFIVSQITMLLTNLKFHKTNTNLFENIDYYYTTLHYRITVLLTSKLCLAWLKKPTYFTILFSFLLLFISLTVLFNTIYRFYCTISINFYFMYLKKNSIFN